MEAQNEIKVDVVLASRSSLCPLILLGGDLPRKYICSSFINISNVPYLIVQTNAAYSAPVHAGHISTFMSPHETDWNKRFEIYSVIHL